MNKIRKIKNRKMNSKRILGLASLILAGGLITSCNNIGLQKHHQYTRLEFTSDGEYKETRQFKPFDTSNNNSVYNSFIYYGEWKVNENSKYEREVKEYSIKNKTYDELKDVIYSDEKVEELLGKPRETYTQMIDYVSDEEINRGPYYEVTIYTEDDNKYVYIKDSNKHIWLLLGSIVLVHIAIGAGIVWNRHNAKEMEEEKKKLTLKREN